MQLNRGSWAVKNRWFFAIHLWLLDANLFPRLRRLKARVMQVRRTDVAMTTSNKYLSQLLAYWVTLLLTHLLEDGNLCGVHVLELCMFPQKLTSLTSVLITFSRILPEHWWKCCNLIGWPIAQYQPFAFKKATFFQFPRVLEEQFDENG